jgi:hypothetical protein
MSQMLRKTWRRVQARAWIWAALTALLPAWAYATCPNNCPSDDGPTVTGDCVHYRSCDWLVLNGEYACPYFNYQNPDTECRQCKFYIGCLHGACEYYLVHHYYYDYWGCTTNQYRYSKWKNLLQDENLDQGCC